jgi:hypothetical protein
VDSILKRGGGVFFVFFLDRSNAPSLDFLCKFLSEDFEMGRTPGTCKWILNHSAFTDWCENTDSEARLLLIYGNPASRKSVVSSCKSNSQPGFDDPDNGKLWCTIVPLEIDLRLKIPRSLLSDGKLVFLDEDYWLCTWRLPTCTNVGGRRRSTSTAKAVSNDVKRHDFLPGDWIHRDSTSLCCLMSDGTLLYPRNGDVAVVQSETDGTQID